MIALNGYEIKPTIFPDGTSQVWKIPREVLDSRQYNILFEFENESEIFHLQQLNKLIKHAAVPRNCNLHMPYLPYGRQDKEVSNETTFALGVFADIINSMRFSKVTSVDAHSWVAESLFDRFENQIPYTVIQATLVNSGSNCIAFPDEGAKSRYQYLAHNLDIIVGHKNRNQLTGYIENYTIEGNPERKSILIVDDIVDGGMTFKLMSEELLKQGAKEVNLYASHGIFSKGIETLKESGINRIFTYKGEVK